MNQVRLWKTIPLSSHNGISCRCYAHSFLHVPYFKNHTDLIVGFSLKRHVDLFMWGLEGCTFFVCVFVWERTALLVALP